MRKSYMRALFHLLRQGKLHKRAPGMILQALSAHIRPGLAGPITPPILATMEVTRLCNLKCPFCESHEGTSPGADLQMMLCFINEIAAAGVKGLGFTGGEPLLYKPLDLLARSASKAGLLTHLNTNGTLLDRDRAARLFETGLSSINVSLDGTDAPTHDRLRGTGSFAQTLAGIEALVDARELLNADTRLMVVMTIGNGNAHQAQDLPAFCSELGVDGCSFLPLSMFSVPGVRKLSSAGAEAAAKLSSRAGEKTIDSSKGYLKGMAGFFKGALMPSRCSALHSSVLVSCDGRIYPCVPSSLKGTGRVPYAPGELMQLLMSGKLSSCIDFRLCAACWWNCHRELDLVLGVI